MLDYTNDEKCQVCTFDPYLLYFHRRITKVDQAINKILESSLSESAIPGCPSYLSKKLESYLSDPQIIRALSLYEKAFSIFGDIRASLRLLDVGNSTSPIYESYEISPLEQKEIFSNISDLKSKLNKQMPSTEDTE